MNPAPIPYLRRLKLLCMGRVDDFVQDRSRGWMTCCALVILSGCGLYGVSVGLWRSPLQSVYTALKVPLLIFLTCAGNALLNGMLGQMLGSGLGFRQTSMVILLSFTLAAVILGALSPVAIFVLYSAPPLASAGTGTGHSVMLLTHVCLIAFAGVIANHRLLLVLRRLCPSPAAAAATLFAWLAGNLLLGAQLAWVLRPFIGSPHLPVQLLRDDPLRGNFFEAVWHAIRSLLGS